MWAGFAASDDPLNADEVEPGERTEQGLAGQEPHRGGYLPQVLDPAGDGGVLDRDADPDVRRPRQVRGEAPQTGRAFREQLVGVLRRRGHH